MTADARAGEAGVGRAYLRRAGGVRAFEDKQGGWTLIAAGGESFRLVNPASLCLWEALDGGATRGELVALLARRFPCVPRPRLEADAAGFLAQLETHGFLEVAVRQGDAGGRRRDRRPPG